MVKVTVRQAYSLHAKALALKCFIYIVTSVSRIKYDTVTAAFVIYKVAVGCTHAQYQSANL